MNVLKIGNFVLNSRVALAPMAGITDFVMRKLVRKHSDTCLITTEMLSSEALVRHPDGLISFSDGNEAPVAFQIEGHKPELMAQAAKIVEKYSSVIDINMGCPVNKVVKGNDGCSLMRNPELAKDIVVAVKENINVPLTCKFRLGWSNDQKNFIEFAALMQSAGADAITVHARTRAQMYSGKAQWTELAGLRGEIDIPYFANGDIVSVESAAKCLEITKSDGLAVGRAVMGDLTLLKRIETFLSTGIVGKEPSLSEKIPLLKEHLIEEIKFRGEENGIKFFRKFYPCYIKSFPGGSELRYKLVTETNFDKIMVILDEAVNYAKNG